MATSATAKTRISSRGKSVEVNLPDLSKSWDSSISIYQLNLLTELQYLVVQEASKNLKKVFSLTAAESHLEEKRACEHPKYR